MEPWKSILSILNLVVIMGIIAIQQLLPFIANSVINAVSIRSMTLEPRMVLYKASTPSFHRLHYHQTLHGYEKNRFYVARL